jgi:AcrR family transcriptional regulator
VRRQQQPPPVSSPKRRLVRATRAAGDPGAGRPDPRRRLHHALIDLCFERGLADIDVDVLCARAAVSRPDFDSLYADLEDCFFAVYSAEFERYARQIEAARAGSEAWRDRLRATAYGLLRYLSEDRRLTHFTVVEVRRAGERCARLMGSGIEALTDLLDEGRLEPGAPAGLTRATASSLAGGLFNQLYLAVGDAEYAAEAEIVPGAMYTAVLPYLGPAAAAQELSIPPPPRPARQNPGPGAFDPSLR